MVSKSLGYRLVDSQGVGFGGSFGGYLGFSGGFWVWGVRFRV